METTQQHEAAHEAAMEAANDTAIEQVQTMDGAIEVAKKELAKVSKTDAAIAELKAKWLPFKIEGLEDKEGYKSAKKAVTELRTARTSVEKMRKALNENANKYIKAVNDEAKRITGELSPIEEHVKSEVERIDKEAERLKKEKQERFVNRTNELLGMGFAFNGELYILDGEAFGLQKRVIAPYNIEQSEPEEWATLTAAYKALAEGIEAARKKQEEEKAAREKALQDEVERLRAELAELKASKAPQATEQTAPAVPPVEAFLPPVSSAPSSAPKANGVPTMKNPPPPAAAKQGVPASDPWPFAPAASTPAASQNNSTASPNNSHVTHDFAKGWSACRAKVVELLSDETKQLKRKEWIELFKTIEP